MKISFNHEDKMYDFETDYLEVKDIRSGTIHDGVWTFTDGGTTLKAGETYTASEEREANGENL